MKRLFLVSTIVLVLATVVFAAGAKETEDKGDGTSVLRFSWWGGDSRHEATLEVINSYMEAHPNVKIEAEYGGWSGYLERLATQLASGTAPDIIQISVPWLGDFTSSNEDIFIDFNDYSDIVVTSGFNQSELGAFATANGKLYGLPTGTNTYFMLFNKNILDKHAMDISAVPSWDELIEKGRKLNAADPNDYLIANIEAEHVLVPLVRQITGNQWVNSDDFSRGFERQDLIEAYELILKLYDNNVAMPVEEAILYATIDENPKWINQQLAGAVVTASSAERSIPQGLMESDMIVTTRPVLPGAEETGFYSRPAQLLVVNGESEHIEEAVRFVRDFLMDPKTVEMLGTVRGVPSEASARAILGEKKMIQPFIVEILGLVGELTTSLPDPLSFNAELMTINNDVFDRMRFRQVTPAQAADELIKRYDQRLNELRDAAN